MARAFIGYHGTSQRRAAKIIRERRYKLSVDTEKRPQWLGDGVYFFEKLSWANRWAKYRYRDDCAVVKSRIIAHSVFDLEEPDDYDEFMYVAKLIIDTCKEHGEECRLKNGVVLNFIYNKIRKFDVARGIFTWEIDNALEEWINVPEAHIQLCVRNPECIKSFKLL
ncbi:hypothetical protein [Sporolituus thermophilus]|uniref:Uncharacterized protein n=1 Tax=Sporolituus thermophilus DSM 23256 TaxID=1123285 RepID=A0A1G7L838_9FIRM|nr:hypothetical protein [Sporolituus thermophilus]SDF45687.1 hypothetical protein SAMN05660235_01662 [Sporolituus thermophilus DSM 23256]